MPHPSPPTVGSSSPWGAIQHRTPLGPDALAVSTTSHGGIWVSPAALARIPAPLRTTRYSGAGWFEEDCDWAIPYLALRLEAFETELGGGARQRDAARRLIWAFHRPHAVRLGVTEDPAASGGRSDG